VTRAATSSREFFATDLELMSTDSLPALPGPADHTIFSDADRRAFLERHILPGYLVTARWFGGKARAPRAWHIRDVVPISSASDAARLILLEIIYAEGPPDTYLLPLQIAAAETAAHLPTSALVARLADGAVLFDALHDEVFRAALFDLMAGGRTFRGTHGEVAGSPGAILGHHTGAPPSRALAVEQSNSSIIYGDAIFLKLYRRLEEGVNPDAEILRFLGGQSFPHVPPFGGAVEYRGAEGGTRVLALALGMVPNDGDAWSFTLGHLAQYYASVLADDLPRAAQLRTTYLSAAEQLGTRTGELHRALASDSGAPGFAPEPFSTGDATVLGTTLRSAVQQVRTLLLERADTLDADTRALTQRLLDNESALLLRADALAAFSTVASKTRTHGDYHLGQVLHGPGGFVIIDFEGEPMSPLAERRRKMSPFRDVAGMLRSFHYAAHAALEPLADTRPRLAADAEAWAHGAQQTFLDAWLAATIGAVFRDPDPANEQALLHAFLLEKALYEVRYEVNNRPTWLGIPLRGVLALLD
jgi:maltose alpha-D-glucosyltransferase/alpha-amylase